MRSYGSVAAPIGHTTHVPLPKGPVGRGDDVFTQLERAHARTSPIIQRQGPDPDAVARLIRLGILTVVTDPTLEEDRLNGPSKTVARRKPKTRRPSQARAPKAPRQPRPPRYDAAAMIADYQDHTLSLSQVAAMHGVSNYTVIRVMRDNNITMRGRGFRTAGAQQGPAPAFDVTAAIQAANAGATMDQLEAQFGVTARTLRKHLAAAGVRAADRRRDPAARKPRATRNGTLVDSATIVTLYQDGKTVPQIADQLGYGIATVRRHINRSGIPKRDDRSTNSGGRNAAIDNPDVVDDMVRLYTQDRISERLIGERLGFGQKTVHGALLSRGVTIRTTAQAQKGRPGADNARGLKDLMAEGGITSADVRTWARDTGRPIPGRGLPPRHLAEAYLLLRRTPTTKEGTPA